jgi:Ca2+-binding EF-hand superfamily protein
MLAITPDFTPETMRKNMCQALKIFFILSASVIILNNCSGPAFSLTPTREQVQKSRERRFQDLDKNQDGKVSVTEYFAFYKADSPQRRQFLDYEFRKYDRNGDGFITREEFFAPVSLKDEFRALDKNRDGKVSREEFLDQEKIFRSLDLNHDGFITLEEYLYGYRNRTPQK